MAANTASAAAPFTRIVPRGGDKDVVGSTRISVHVGLYTNHLAPSLSMAQKLNRAPTESESGATAEAPSLDAAYSEVGDGMFRASLLTRGPWHPDHQHAGPPSALICRAIERFAAKDGLTHLGAADRQSLAARAHRRVPGRRGGRTMSAGNAGHYSGRLIAQGKDVARFTALMQREEDLPVPDGTRRAIRRLSRAEAARPKPGRQDAHGAAEGVVTAHLVENRIAAGRFFNGPCAAWFRMNHPLIQGEHPSPYQRVAVAGDSGNGVSAALDFTKYVFINCDLTINLFRRTGWGNGSCLQMARQPVRRQLAADWREFRALRIEWGPTGRYRCAVTR